MLFYKLFILILSRSSKLVTMQYPSLSSLFLQKNQQIIDQLKAFILDWNNLTLFSNIVEQNQKPETIFVFYSLMQKSWIKMLKIYNMLQFSFQKQSTFKQIKNNEIIITPQQMLLMLIFQLFFNCLNHKRKYIKLQAIRFVLFQILDIPIEKLLIF
ncbi:unnamed protein product (macronuclear) [Paramecium tetraurelia]|uniref:Transmembrane protein n=1 Tax=Paramecium tetraurelia TaxID=5888 RepID=A0D9B0_PARTE|nr:uncharacterized protein GSPATT00014557001 [Paramecium tetraurelia]CAK79627.1 unnamed protein product [Paramecium tetraurelia]|eukprot:XP_001447024.1 hypothetical protein (macronuclear) [Paramecium tetraurelia strain d4-2]